MSKLIIRHVLPGTHILVVDNLTDKVVADLSDCAGEVSIPINFGQHPYISFRLTLPGYQQMQWAIDMTAYPGENTYVPVTQIEDRGYPDWGLPVMCPIWVDL